MTTPFIINHLWQSSCFTLLAGLLAFVLRKNSPKVRYWVWQSASLKFLAPFALLVSLGSVVPRRPAHPVSATAPVFPNALLEIVEPFSPTLKAAVPTQAPLRGMPVAIGIGWALGFLVITLARCRSWLGVQAALRAATPIELPIPVQAVITSGGLEPGIAGFLRPVLVLPAQLLEHLNPRQLRAILTHEMCHVRRRDNLFAAVHMVVEAIFWFDPLVWWIGSRLGEERELACDEEVLREGCEPKDYLEGILKVCRFQMGSLSPCISGVAGANVKRRLRVILAGSIAHELNGAKKVTLAAVVLVALAAPVLIGMLNAPATRAQDVQAASPKFEVVSIKACKEPPQQPGRIVRRGENSSPGNLRTGCVPLLDGNGIGLIRDAYRDGLNNGFVPITGGPPWLRSAFYEINATAEGHESVRMMMGPMLRVLLEDRFQLKTHRQASEGPVYTLTVARGGPKLHSFTEGSCTRISTFPPPPLQPGQVYCKNQISARSPASLEIQGATLDDFAKLLLLVVDRPVINKTGITGQFDIRIEFSREGTKMAAMPLIPPVGGLLTASDPTGTPSLFAALQEELGLRLESAKGEVESLVVDHIERPAEN
jgi:uncharacterized protein (TIGR03435 family)